MSKKSRKRKRQRERAKLRQEKSRQRRLEREKEQAAAEKNYEEAHTSVIEERVRDNDSVDKEIDSSSYLSNESQQKENENSDLQNNETKLKIKIDADRYNWTDDKKLNKGSDDIENVGEKESKEGSLSEKPDNRVKDEHIELIEEVSDNNLHGDEEKNSNVKNYGIFSGKTEINEIENNVVNTTVFENVGKKLDSDSGNSEKDTLENNFKENESKKEDEKDDAVRVASDETLIIPVVDLEKDKNNVTAAKTSEEQKENASEEVSVIKDNEKASSEITQDGFVNTDNEKTTVLPIVEETKPERKNEDVEKRVVDSTVVAGAAVAGVVGAGVASSKNPRVRKVEKNSRNKEEDKDALEKGVSKKDNENDSEPEEKVEKQNKGQDKLKIAIIVLCSIILAILIALSIAFITTVNNSETNNQTPVVIENNGTSSDKSSPTATHVHNWIPQYQSIHHDAITHTVHHDAEYGTRTVNHTICNDCHAYIEGQAEEHLQKSGHSGYASGVPVTEQYLIHEAYDEVIVDQEAYDEQVLTGYKCATCGVDVDKADAADYGIKQ